MSEALLRKASGNPLSLFLMMRDNVACLHPPINNVDVLVPLRLWAASFDRSCLKVIKVDTLLFLSRTND